MNILNEAENPAEIYVLLEIPENIPFPKGVRTALLEAFSFLRSPVEVLLCSQELNVPDAMTVLGAHSKGDDKTFKPFLFRGKRNDGA